MLRTSRAVFAAALLVSTLSVAAGCRYRQTTKYPTPAASGLSTRDLMDPVAQAEAEEFIGADRFVTNSTKVGEKIREELRNNVEPGRPPRNVLCLSGGGSYGAYSAGVLCGWTERGDRPCFDVVTGISTGALIAPFAFLGPKYDAQMKKFYTTSENEDIYTKQYVKGILGGESFTDTAPLRKQISDVLTPQMICEIAQAHAAGRRLIIGTTEEEGRRFIVWDLGAIAARNGPRDRDLMIDVMIGSASIPGVFPATKIDVNVDGEWHTERHVDGGVSQALFFYPPYVPPEARSPQTLNLVDTNVYVILAGKLYSDAEVIQPSALKQAGKAVSTLIYAQGRGDMQRLWIFCMLGGMNFHLCSVPTEYPNMGSSGEFKPKEMLALFNEGRKVICSPTAWRTTPPMTDADAGELPQARWGRELMFVPRGPQLTINGPKKMKVPPKYPGVVPAGSPVITRP